jgi:flagellar hook-length control protein FliK
MSNFMLPLPAGKKASAHVPEADGGKIPPSRIAGRKKPRSFSESKPGRKKSFRHHLDQALGKGFPAAVVSHPPKDPVAPASGKSPGVVAMGKGFPVGTAQMHAKGAISGAETAKTAVPPVPGLKTAPAGERSSHDARPGLPVSFPGNEAPSVEDRPVPVSSAGMATETPVAPAVPTAPSILPKKPVERAALPQKVARNGAPVTPFRKTPSPSEGGSLPLRRAPGEVASPTDANANTVDAFGFDKRLNGALNNAENKNPSDRFPLNDSHGLQAGESRASDSAMAPPAVTKGGSPDDPSPGFSKEDGKGKGESGDPSRLSLQSPTIVGGAAPAVPVPDRPAEPARVPEFAEKIAETAKSGGGTVTLRVHPPELGPVVVTVQVDPRSKAVDVRLSVRDASVRSAIEGKGDALKRLLREEGFSMHSLDVSLGEAGTLSAGAVLSPGPSSQSGAQSSGTFNSQASPQDFSGGATLSSGGDGQGSGGTRENGSSAPTDGRLEHLPEESGDEMTFNGTGNVPGEHRGFHRIA